MSYETNQCDTAADSPYASEYKAKQEIEYQHALNQRYNAASPARRTTAQDMLRETLAELQAKINELEALSRALPAELPYAADEALKGLVQMLRRLR